MTGRYFHIILYFFAATTSISAQWQWAHPQPQGNDLWNVHFASGTATGWAVGAAGIIVRSSDAGASWTVQNSQREDVMRGVFALDAQSAWVVGDNGVVLRTANGGSTWQTQNSGTTAGINTIFAVNTSTAAFVGDAGMLRTTTDGGTTWVARTTGSSSNLNGVHFASAMNGVAVGSAAAILQTTNGGASWIPRAVSPGMLYADLIDVFFVDASYGWAVGTGGTVIRSTDGGSSWSRMMNNGASADLNKVRFTDRQHGWCVGEGGAIYRTTNGGSSWTAMSSGTTNGLEGLALHGSTVIVAGLYGDLLRSNASGGFTMVTAGTRASINAVSAAIPSSAWAVTSAGEVLASSNAGHSWQLRAQPTTQPLYGIDNINGQVLVACGNGGLILRSTNAGYNWSVIASGTTVALNGIDLLDNDTGYIVGSSGRILKTTNAGAGWYAVASGTLESLFGVHFTDQRHGSVVGSNGKVISTTNGGYTWLHQQSWTMDALFHVIRDGDRGMLCGDDGTVSFTTDGGQSWSDCTTSTTAALFHLTHPAPNEYAAVGENGTIVRTSDFGQTWVREISHAQHTLYGADAHGGNVYVVGDYGSALRNGNYPYPVTLRSFTATRRDGCALLRWEVAEEVSLFGYALERRRGGTWQEVGFLIAGRGEYDWIDCGAVEGEASWRLKMLDMDGTWEYSPEVQLSAGVTDEPDWFLSLYPQPAHGTLYVRMPARVQHADVYDMRGRHIHTLSSPGAKGATVPVRGEIFPVSGNYLIVIGDGSKIAARTFQVLK